MGTTDAWLGMTLKRFSKITIHTLLDRLYHVHKSELPVYP